MELACSTSKTSAVVDVTLELGFVAITGTDAFAAMPVPAHSAVMGDAAPANADLLQEVTLNINIGVGPR
jgi:hypothetical protein